MRAAPSRRSHSRRISEADESNAVLLAAADDRKAILRVIEQLLRGDQ
jgi:hypothetical protein